MFIPYPCNSDARVTVFQYNHLKLIFKIVKYMKYLPANVKRITIDCVLYTCTCF